MVRFSRVWRAYRDVEALGRARELVIPGWPILCVSSLAHQLTLSIHTLLTLTTSSTPPRLSSTTREESTVSDSRRHLRSPPTSFQSTLYYSLLTPPPPLYILQETLDSGSLSSDVTKTIGPLLEVPTWSDKSPLPSIRSHKSKDTPTLERSLVLSLINVIYKWTRTPPKWPSWELRTTRRCSLSSCNSCTSSCSARIWMNLNEV